MPTIAEIRAQYPKSTAGKTDWDIVQDVARANKADLWDVAQAYGVEVPAEENGFADSVQGGIGKQVASVGAAIKGDTGAWIERTGRGIAERNPVEGSGIFEASSGVVLVIVLAFLARWSISKFHTLKAKAGTTPLVSDLVAPITAVPLSVDDESIYAAIADELESGQVVKGLWTKVSAECNFDEAKMKATYIKRRFVDLKSKAKS
jgi:hypothetical protein